MGSFPLAAWAESFDLVLVLLLLLGLPVAVCGLFAWTVFRELLVVLVGRKRSGGRRKPRFSLRFLFAFTAAMALAWGVVGPSAADVDAESVFLTLLAAVILTGLLYFAVLVVSDLMVDFDLLTPPTVSRARLPGRRPAARDPFDQADARPVEVREPAGNHEQAAEGRPKRKRRKRRWWTRAMPSRVHPIMPGQDHEIPIDRDEYAG